MTRELFQQSIVKVQEDILSLGGQVEGALLRSVELLRNRDAQGAQELIQQDQVIDEQRYAIEAEVLTTVATQAPIGSDMRALAAALFISNELERMADYCKGIARINLRIGDEPLLNPFVDIPHMAEIAHGMLHDSLRAYEMRDDAAAMNIIPRDDELDKLYEQVYKALMIDIMEDVSQIRQANLLLMVAHNLERIGDRTTNICERVVYIATGQFIEVD